MMPWLKAVPAALRLVPSWVWGLLAVALAWHFAQSWHAGKIAEHDRQLVAARDAQWQVRFNDMRQQALDWKAKAEVSGRTIAEQQRKLNDEKMRRIAAADDDLRLRGPGQAAAPAGCRPVDPAGLSTGAGGSGAPAHGADAGGAVLPGGDRSTDWAVVPWNWLRSRARQCDADAAEALSWRNDHQLQAANWEKLRQSQGKVKADGRPE